MCKQHAAQGAALNLPGLQAGGLSGVMMNRLGLSLLTPAELVDEYATVVAEARALEERKKQLQELMDATGQTKLAGSINRVTIVTMPGAKMVMVKDMVADQVVTQSAVDSYTKQGTPFKQYRLSV